MFFLPLLTWLLDFLGPDFGPWPWLGLSFALALYHGLAGGLITLVARLPLAPLWGALIFIALETPRAWFPFGGFPWGRVAFSQPEGAFLPLASIGGAPLVGLAVVVTGFCLAAVAARLWDGRDALKPALRARRTVLAAAGTLLPVVAGLALWPAIGTGAQDGERTVATVQGNAPDIGLALQGERDRPAPQHHRRERAPAGRDPRREGGRSRTWCCGRRAPPPSPAPTRRSTSSSRTSACPR